MDNKGRLPKECKERVVTKFESGLHIILLCSVAFSFSLPVNLWF